MGDGQRKAKLLVLSHFYEPEPHFITADVASRLSADFDVTVIAPHPNYPLDSFYPGTKAWWRPVKTFERGVNVWRLPVVPYHGLSHFRRALCYLSFALPAMLLAPFLVRRPAVVWVYLGPFFAALAALPLKLAGARVVFTVADLWPESLLAAGVAKPGLKVRLLYACRRAINRLADEIICSTRGILERFAGEGIPRQRLHFVPVWVEGIPPGGKAAVAIDVPRPAPGGQPGPSVVYAGNIGPAQHLETVLDAAAQLAQQAVPIVFDFYGSGSEEARLRQLAAERGLRNVRFHGRVSQAEAFAVSAAALGQIISLAPSPLFEMTVPSKLSVCCAAGSPLLYGLAGEAAAMAAASGGGIPFDPRDPSTLATAVVRLLECSTEERARMSARLRLYYAAHFDAKVLFDRYRGIVLPGPGRRRQAA